MRTSHRQKWAELSESTPTTSSSALTASTSFSGDHSGYSYYSEGSGSYYVSSSSSASSRHARRGNGKADATSSSASSASKDAASVASSTSASASTYSAASDTQKSGRSSGSSESSRTLASSSDALDGTAPAAKHKRLFKSSGSAYSSSTSNGVTVDDADALVVAVPSSNRSSNDASAAASPLSNTALTARVGSLALRGADSGSSAVVVVPASSRDIAVVPASPYHFSEEELVRQPWAREADATTTHTSEEGVVSSPRAVDVLDTIHTEPVQVPPPPEEVERRRRDGGLPFPSHLTFPILPGAAPAAAAAAGASEATTKDAAIKTVTEGGERAKKTLCDSLCCGAYSERRRTKEHNQAEARAATRQQSYQNQLRSHHVPLVSFRTARDARTNLLDGDNALPTVEEAAGYRHLEDDMMGAEAQPKKLQKAMRQRHRPGSGLRRWRTSYAFGRRAGGGPRGAGESAFLHDGDPQRFWIAQLHERAQVHLEAIEAE